MRVALLWIIAAAAGLGAGAGSAIWAAGRLAITGPDAINVAGWRSDWAIGSAAADPHTRARIARHGLLALAKEEAVYFTRATDEGGARLREGCDYELSGVQQPGEWWSITLYDAESRLPINDDDALSIDASRQTAEAWRVLIAPERPDSGAWLSSRNAGAFDLTLRIYRPDARLIADPVATLPAPRVRRLACRKDTA